MDPNIPVSLNVQSPNEQVRSIYERFHPRMIALADKVALASRQKNELGSLMYNAKELGMTSEDQEKSELQRSLQEKTAMFVDATKDLDDSAYQQASEKFLKEQASPYPQRQTAQLNTPNAMQGGLALLAAVLDPQNAAQTIAQPFLYQSQDQQVRQGQNDQQYGDQLRERNERIGSAETRMNVEERRLGKAQNSQDRQAAVIDRQIRDIQDRIEKLDQRKQTAINHAYSAYNAANTPSEKRVAGQRLQTLLRSYMPEIAPADEEIASSVRELEMVNDRFASQEWEKALGAELNLFGEVEETRGVDLERQRIAIAQRYGIDPNNLRTVPTGKTIASQKLALAQQRFGFLKSKTAEEFKVKWANLQVARQRAMTYAQAVANGYALGGMRNEISMGHLQMRQYESQLKATAKGAKSIIQGYVDKLKQESDPEKAAKLRADLNLFLQNTAGEFGIDPGEWVANPLGTMQKFMDSLEEEAPEMPDLGIPPAGVEFDGVNPPTLTGPIGKPTAVKKPAKKPVAKNKPASKPVKLPPGWGKNF